MLRLATQLHSASLIGIVTPEFQRVQELIETPLVSTSPEREDTILVRDPFVD